MPAGKPSFSAASSPLLLACRRRQQSPEDGDPGEREILKEYLSQNP
jgi:hypothetical protein